MLYSPSSAVNFKQKFLAHLHRHVADESMYAKTRHIVQVISHQLHQVPPPRQPLYGPPYFCSIFHGQTRSMFCVPPPTSHDNSFSPPRAPHQHPRPHQRGRSNQTSTILPPLLPSLSKLDRYLPSSPVEKDRTRRSTGDLSLAGESKIGTV